MGGLDTEKSLYRNGRWGLMQTIYAICQWLEQTRISVGIRDSSWIFTALETAHIFALIVVVGSTSVLDLRLLGVAFKDYTFSRLAGYFLPWTWSGFALQVITGVTMFAPEATKMYDNRAFRIKILLIGLAGANAFLFHSLAFKSVGRWEKEPIAPLSARFAGIASIVLWFAIVGAGRWIAYI
jgi:hypothetical protein